ncbi:MAG: hypothetical protein JW941_03365 [Candidatus Coatesbacteria bacterium]|nr:hypothetical protein [Candidatus Coatesbacteria bacterium]
MRQEPCCPMVFLSRASAETGYNSTDEEKDQYAKHLFHRSPPELWNKHWSLEEHREWAKTALLFNMI